MGFHSHQRRQPIHRVVSGVPVSRQTGKRGVYEVSQQVTEEIASRTKKLVIELLGDGEWHSHRVLVGDLIRTPLSEYEIRRALRTMREDPMVEAENRRISYRHSPSWWYRLRGANGNG